MNKVADYWNERYAKDIGFEELVIEKPSIAVQKFVAYLKESKIPLRGTLLDVGCGMGRSSNWLTQQGFEVTGIDISSVAVQQARQRAQKLGLSVDYRIVDITQGLPFPGTSFDFVIDVVTNQLLSGDARGTYKQEVMRILKPNGRFLLYTLDRSVDTGAQNLITEHPGLEENTYIIPQIGLMERTFTLEEIKSFWLPLTIESSELLRVPSKFQGVTYERYFWLVILGKHEDKS